MGWPQKRSRPGRSSAGENEGQPLSLLGVVLLSVARNGRHGESHCDDAMGGNDVKVQTAVQKRGCVLN